MTNCAECGVPTPLFGLCKECQVAQKQLDVMRDAERERHRIAEREPNSELERVIRELRSREDQSKITNLAEDKLGVFGTVKCLITAFSKLMQGGGFLGAKRAYLIKSRTIKIDTYIDKLAMVHLIEWARHSVHLQAAKIPKDIEALFLWADNYFGYKIMTSPTNMTNKALIIWLKSELTRDFNEKVKCIPTKKSEESDPDFAGDSVDSSNSEADPLYDEAVGVVLRTRRASISAVQRQLRIGYNRAARLIEDMERAGLVSAMQSNGNREVLAPYDDA